MKALVTGAAGFIGMHTSLWLLERGDEVIGLDDLNAYDDPALKAARLARLEAQRGFTFVRGSLEDIQPGDVPATWADVDALRDAVGFAPATPIEEGVGRFVAWYREFYGT